MNMSYLSKMDLTMESLALPRELYWDGKMEPPSSPSAASCELFPLNLTPPNWLYDDNFANELTIMSDESSDIKQNLELLMGDEDFVVDLDFKEEYLLDAKFQTLPQLVDYTNSCVDVAHPNPLIKVQAAGASNDFLNCFGNGSTGFDTAVLAQLTPPQSPPQNGSATVVATTAALYQQQQHMQPMSIAAINEPEKNYQQEQQQIPTTPVMYNVIESPTVETPPPAFHFNFGNTNDNSNQNHAAVSNGTADNNNDIAREMQLVDEIVNIRAQELHDWHDDDDDCASQSSSIYTAGDSNSSQLSSNDDEWLSTSGTNSLYCPSNSSSPTYHGSSYNHNNSSSSTSAALKKRTRTYGRGIEDRKIRKKEQNKNAATRYRQKKKLEMEEVLSEEQQLIQRNDELKRSLAERKHESKYLRKLLREFYQGRKL